VQGRSLRAYAAHPDRATSLTNGLALMLGCNGPIYPLYVVALVGWHAGALAFLCMFASPFFLAIPAVARRNATAGRLALIGVGTLNTVWCIKLFGPASGVGLFLLPCVMLAALIYRREERYLMFAAALVPFAAGLVPARLFGAAIIKLSPGLLERLTVLNHYSVSCLFVLLAVQFARFLRATPAR
jgi:hypothetical protein